MTEDYAARVADDDDPLRRILRAARAWGRPPSVFMGGRVVTHHIYDPSTLRLVRSETIEWTGHDLEMALALQAYEAGLCGGCGDPLAETTKRENDGRYTVEIDMCHRCVALDIASSVERPHPSALQYTVELKPPDTT